MSAPSTPSRKRGADAGAAPPNQSPSKKSKTPSKNFKSNDDVTGPSPKITSSVTVCPSVPGEALPDERQQFHDLLRRHLDSVIEKAATARPAEKKRHMFSKIRIFAAMAVLYAPWSEDMWAEWYRKIGRRFVKQNFVDCFGTVTQDLVKAWQIEPPVPEARSNQTRSQVAINAQREVREWYAKLCILTGTNTTAACHIIANAIERNDQSGFWQCLDLFWSQEQVDMLLAMMETEEYQKRNLLILDNGVHTAWSESRFALKPLPGLDANELRLEFHWLSPGDQGSVEHVQGQATNITDLRRGAPRRDLQTGDQIVLKSVDSSVYLLPDPFLLKLQYHINMVCRACAQGDLLNLLFGEDPDTGDSGVLLVEDESDYAEYDSVPEFNEFLISSALEQGILNLGRANMWRQYLNGAAEDEASESSPDRDLA